MNGSVLEGRLCWDGRVPIQWRVLDRLPDEAQLARAEERNIALLNALALIEEGTPRSDEPSPLVAQMERLEAKFDLVLTLLTEVVLPDAMAPRAVAVRLCSRGMAFEVAYPAEAGSIVELSMHLSASLPRPLMLYGAVLDPLPGEEAHVAVEFRHLGPAVKERLERLVFRRHRRSIAQQRPQVAK